MDLDAPASPDHLKAGLETKKQTMSRILIIEDETPMRTALAHALEAEGHRALTAADGAAGLQRAIEEKPDLILLDIMMPKLDGFALCAELRRLGHTQPVLMLTAKGQVDDRVAGLDAGADDFVAKPFSTAELLARVRALLRRVQKQGKSAARLKFGEIEIDLARQTAARGRKAIHLTAKELSILRLLAETPANLSQGSDFWIWSGVARRFPPRAPSITTSPPCAERLSPARSRRAGSKPCMAWGINWTCDFAKA